ncbi:MAG: homoserine dehydrogenase [Acidiferrobacterales bacterium]|nr:homoserine dehydrogenase [Acidiferrobacterales bacterium]
MKPVKIGIIGLGTVGCGTLTVLRRNSQEISRRAGREIEVAMCAVNDLNKSRDPIVDTVALTDDPGRILESADIDIVVELIGGVEPAHDYVTQALRNGKHVVTANKELLAVRGKELFQTAQNQSLVIAFEAAVGGGISIIKAIREGLAGNRIESLIGIINGTSNYILTGMKEKHCSFNEMLDDAQRLGYAEADPTFDVSGIDAVHKLIILASIAFGVPLQEIRDVHRIGIESITYDDIAYADELGFSIKPLAIAKRGENGVETRVHPALVSNRRLIANVNGVMNAILVTGDAVGRTLFYGAGAGAEPTASAVVADLVDVVRVMTSDPENRVPHLAFQPNSITPLPMLSIDDFSTANYLRLTVDNQAGVLAEVTRILGDQGISIESILQKGTGAHEDVLPVVIITQETVESNMLRAIAQLESLESVRESITRIRIESLA